MDGKEIRLLRADEIECRVGSIGDKGVSLLLFKDARVDMKILDETFTPMGWQRRHFGIEGNLFCSVDIWDDEKQQWITKSDVGTPSYAQKEKGAASDSFKRACVSVGIGRELYSAFFIWIPADKCEIKKDKDGKLYTKDRFSVSHIAYTDEREISELAIVNQSGVEVYRQMKKGEKKIKGQETITIQQVMDLHNELDRTGVSLDAVLERYRIFGIKDMTPEIYTKAMNSLRKTDSKVA